MKNNANSNQTALIEGGSADQLLRRLKEGMIIKTRIVLCLGNSRYLLRIFGYNLVMASNLAFNRFDEIYIKVKSVQPYLVLKILKDYRESSASGGKLKKGGILAV